MTDKEQAVRAAYCFNALQRFMTQAGSENAIVTVESKDGEKEDLLILKEIKQQSNCCMKGASKYDV